MNDSGEPVLNTALAVWASLLKKSICKGHAMPEVGQLKEGDETQMRVADLARALNRWQNNAGRTGEQIGALLGRKSHGHVSITIDISSFQRLQWSENWFLQNTNIGDVRW
jgi:hypothetical protein